MSTPPTQFPPRAPNQFFHVETPLHRPRSLSIKPDPAPLTNLCFKIFVVVAVVLAAVTVIVGILALMAVKGAIPGEQINPLSVIGEVNSYVMISGGALLFILGLLAWSCQLHKEGQQAHFKPSIARRLFT